MKSFLDMKIFLNMNVIFKILFFYRQKHIHDYLGDVLEFTAKQKELNSVFETTKDLHVWPDYHGNRSPLADSTLKGMVGTGDCISLISIT